MRLAPEEPEAHYNLALLYQKQGLETEARAEMAKYRDLSGEAADAE